MASALSTFNDFVDTTGPSFLTSAEDVVNEACRNNYLLRRFLKGKGPQEVVQGGTKIKDTMMFDEKNSLQYYQPNERYGPWGSPSAVQGAQALERATLVDFDPERHGRFPLPHSECV